jgi:hypothetical protein
VSYISIAATPRLGFSFLLVGVPPLVLCQPPPPPLRQTRIGGFLLSFLRPPPSFRVPRLYANCPAPTPSPAPGPRPCTAPHSYTPASPSTPPACAPRQRPSLSTPRTPHHATIPPPCDVVANAARFLAPNMRGGVSLGLPPPLALDKDIHYKYVDKIYINKFV